MGTRGYGRYRGREGRVGKVIWVIALCIVLLAAVAFLLGQQYLIYDDEGNVRWAVPFGQSGDGGYDNPIDPADVTIERQEPEAPPRRALAQVHARELENGALWWQPENVLSSLEEDMVIECKTVGGSLRYATSVTLPAGVASEQGSTRDNLTALLRSDHYAVARIHCFCDTAYARSVPGTALTAADGQLWYDGEGRAWLDPAGAETLAYLTALCQELAELGFDELLLDSFSYPSTGDVSSIDLAADTDQTAILADFAAAIRKTIPETVVLSVAIHADTEGIAKTLYDSFDRLYVDETADIAALTTLLGDTCDAATELAVQSRTKPQSGSYVLLP
ncbi:MAG: hypothetical protein J5482_06535 [Oscillospiraceae bacterium]|nr:hypothetical protein [Oscillospiraceae bacterium]